MDSKQMNESLKSTENQFTKKAEELVNEYNHTLVSSPIEFEFPIANNQKKFLEKDDFSGVYYLFEGKFELGLFRKAVMSLFNKHILLRASIDIQASYWRVHELADFPKIPFLDISDKDQDEQKKIIDKLFQTIYFKSYTTHENLCNRILVIKQSEHAHLLLLPIAHIIFDFMSDSILQKDLLEFYQMHEKNIYKSCLPDLTYLEYSEKINRNISKVSFEELAIYYELPKMMANMTLLTEKVQNLNNETMDIFLEFPLKQVNSLGQMINIIYGFCSHLYETKYIPIWLVNMGRIHGNKIYDKTIGMFLDIVPIYIKEVHKDYDLEQKIHEKIQYKLLNHINFSSSFYEENSFVSMGNFSIYCNIIMENEFSKKKASLFTNERRTIVEDEIFFNFYVSDKKIRLAIYCSHFIDEKFILRQASVLGGTYTK